MQVVHHNTYLHESKVSIPIIQIEYFYIIFSVQTDKEALTAINIHQDFPDQDDSKKTLIPYFLGFAIHRIP